MSDEFEVSVDEEQSVDGDLLTQLNAAIVPSEITVRNAAKRELDIRIMPWDAIAETALGPETFARSAFDGIDPSKVMLMGLEHEVHLGAGQDGRVIPVRRPQGRGISLEARDDGAYMTFRVAKTTAGDEILALADDHIVDGASVEIGKNARIKSAQINGRRGHLVEWSDLRGVAPTYQPAYTGAQVLAVRSTKEEAPVADDKAPAAGVTATEEQPETPTRVDVQARSADDQTLIAQMASVFQQPMDKILDRLEKIEERGRSNFEVPVAKDKPQASLGVWMDTAIRLLTGDRIADAQYRTVQDLITTDNAGIVPDAYVDRLIGRIDARRPFMATTERLPVPESGMNLVVPKINQRPSVAEQTTQKTELSSQKTLIGTESFPVHTYGGVGDISIQLLKRSDPSFLELYLRLLAEAYAIETEDAATAALIEAINDGGPEPAVALDPENLNLGAAFEAAFSSMRLAPDTLWMSSAAVSAFIDAKNSGSNAPLYANLGASFTAGGQSGPISGLRAVHVPALDDKGAYAIAGRSDGFAWAEDGTYTLQVDVPSKAGRDVALVGMVWFAPWYPDAFTLFNVAS